MAKKANKYRNKKVIYDGIKFDSEKERDRYIFLRRAEQVGELSELECHPKFVLIPAIKEKYIKHLKTKDKECERTLQLPVYYSADFRYTRHDGEVVIEDVKPSKFMRTQVFLLKVKLMRYFHGIVIKEIYKANEPI